MTDAADILTIITVAAALVLAVRSFRAHGQGWNRTAMMAAIWVVIIAAVAFLAGRHTP